jgi:hypothetical protein
MSVPAVTIEWSDQKRASGRAAAPQQAHIQLALKTIPLHISASAQAEACRRAAAPGLAALRMNVSKLGRVTGHLQAAVAVKTETYQNGPYGVGVALVGFVKGVAQHSHLVEFGTKKRKLKRAKVFSSFEKRGKWTGPAQYPQNFVRRMPGGVVGKMPAFHPVTRAYESTLGQMTANLKSEMENLADQALKKAAG